MSWDYLNKQNEKNTKRKHPFTSLNRVITRPIVIGSLPYFQHICYCTVLSILVNDAWNQRSAKSIVRLYKQDLHASWRDVVFDEDDAMAHNNFRHLITTITITAETTTITTTTTATHTVWGSLAIVNKQISCYVSPESSKPSWGMDRSKKNPNWQAAGNTVYVVYFYFFFFAQRAHTLSVCMRGCVLLKRIEIRLPANGHVNWQTWSTHIIEIKCVEQHNNPRREHICVYMEYVVLVDMLVCVCGCAAVIAALCCGWMNTFCMRGDMCQLLLS